MLSAIDYQRQLLAVLITLLWQRHICYGYPGAGKSGAIVFPKDDDIADNSRYSTSNSKFTQPTLINSRLGGTSAFSKNIPRSNAGSRSETGGGGDIIVFRDSVTESSVVMKTLPKKNTSNPSDAESNKSNNGVSNNKTNNEGTAQRTDDTFDMDYDSRFTTRVRLNCKCRIGNTCSKSLDC